MEIWLNGDQRRFDAPLSISALLEQTGYAQRRVAVEVNQQIVPKSRHPEQLLVGGDRVEIVHALGGG
jgi:sulfur carrier protein